ncbi:hypothetical protein PINS_up001208 [Pythium insidiosum]|nr:hypothetical protein PINS_up001208 [Pythium insidiosum]
MADDAPPVDPMAVNTNSASYSNSHDDKPSSGSASDTQAAAVQTNSTTTVDRRRSSAPEVEATASSQREDAVPRSRSPVSSSVDPSDPDAQSTPSSSSSSYTRTQRVPSSISPTGVISAVGKNVVLDFVEDSPMFRRQLEGFEESLTGLRSLLKEILSRTKEYVAAGKRYGEEETALAEEIVHRKYARALFTTSCPELGSLSSIFNEVHDTITQIHSSRVSMLLSIEALLHHSINRFAEQELKEAGDLRREVTRLADEYESQLGKLLGKSKQSGATSSNTGSSSGSSALTPSDVTHILGGNVSTMGSSSSNIGSGSGGLGALGRMASLSTDGNISSGGGTSSSSRSLERDAMQARLRFELARFDLVRYLNRLECQKKFVLIECFNSTLYAFLGHFHACHELVKSVESGVRQRQEMLQQSRRDFEEDEAMWASQREALEARLKMDADGEIRGTRAASLELPVEIISGETHHSREQYASASNGGSNSSASNSTGAIIKQGYLFMRNSMFPARSWKRRWFQIHSGKLYHNKGKHMDLALVCDLMLSRVRESTSSNLPYCFEIIDAKPVQAFAAGYKRSRSLRMD